MFSNDGDGRGRPPCETEIERALGGGRAAVDDPATDPGNGAGALPSDAQEWAAPPPEAA